MRIVVDAMGSDNHPGPDVGGAVLAAREWPEVEVVLVGDRARVEAELANHQTAGLKVEVVHAGEFISMTDQPAAVVKGKPDSSMHVGMQLVKDGQAGGFVSAGNTGGLLAVATLGVLRRMRGVKRPAVAPFAPTPFGGFLLLDMGANADARPEFLYQFGLMGSIYAERVLGIANPRVALLSIGEEEGKGNQLVRDAALLLADSPLNFVGNAEPKELLAGHADVAVADGFTGDIFVKTIEATGKMLVNVISEEIRSGPLTTLGGLLARPAFRRVGYRYSSEAVGGAPLLGVEGVVISAHGSSSQLAMKSAIRQARDAVEGGLVQALREGLAG